MDYATRERVKAINRDVMNDPEEDFNDRIRAAERVMEALWWRSMEAYAYRMGHPTLEKYIAMLMKQKDQSELVPPDIRETLIIKYGKKRGIREGTYF